MPCPLHKKSAWNTCMYHHGKLWNRWGCLWLMNYPQDECIWFYDSIIQNSEMHIFNHENQKIGPCEHSHPIRPSQCVAPKDPYESLPTRDILWFGIRYDTILCAHICTPWPPHWLLKETEDVSAFPHPGWVGSLRPEALTFCHCHISPTLPGVTEKSWEEPTLLPKWPSIPTLVGSRTLHDQHGLQGFTESQELQKTWPAAGKGPMFWSGSVESTEIRCSMCTHLQTQVCLSLPTQEADKYICPDITSLKWRFGFWKTTVNNSDVNPRDGTHDQTQL